MKKRYERNTGIAILNHVSGLCTLSIKIIPYAVLIVC
jgi:hypothetical protein